MNKPAQKPARKTCIPVSDLTIGITISSVRQLDTEKLCETIYFSDLTTAEDQMDKCNQARPRDFSLSFEGFRKTSVGYDSSFALHCGVVYAEDLAGAYTVAQLTTESLLKNLPAGSEVLYSISIRTRDPIHTELKS